MWKYRHTRAPNSPLSVIVIDLSSTWPTVGNIGRLFVNLEPYDEGLAWAKRIEMQPCQAKERGGFGVYTRPPAAVPSWVCYGFR